MRDLRDRGRLDNAWPRSSSCLHNTEEVQKGRDRADGVSARRAGAHRIGADAGRLRDRDIRLHRGVLTLSMPVPGRGAREGSRAIRAGVLDAGRLALAPADCLQSFVLGRAHSV